MASSLATQMTGLSTVIRIPSAKNDATSLTFGSLPLEIRTKIYVHVADHAIGSHLVRASGGRVQFRSAWPLSPQDYRSAQQIFIDQIAQVSRGFRRELLPIIMRGCIVKFPAWTPEFKTRSLDWIGSVSETFCRSIDWLWLEGEFWRLSIHLVGTNIAREKTTWEDRRAQEANVHVHMHEMSETFSREHFVLRIDYQQSVGDQALACAQKTIELVENLLLAAGSDGSMGRAQLESLLTQTPLTGTEPKVEGCIRDVAKV